MRRRKKLFSGVTALLLALVLAGCAIALPEAAETPVSAQTQEPAIVETEAPAPTATPAPVYLSLTLSTSSDHPA